MGSSVQSPAEGSAERDESVLGVHEDELCRRWLADIMRKDGYDVDETSSTTEESGGR